MLVECFTENQNSSRNSYTRTLVAYFPFLLTSNDIKIFGRARKHLYDLRTIIGQSSDNALKSSENS